MHNSSPGPPDTGPFASHSPPRRKIPWRWLILIGLALWAALTIPVAIIIGSSNGLRFQVIEELSSEITDSTIAIVGDSRIIEGGNWSILLGQPYRPGIRTIAIVGMRIQTFDLFLPKVIGETPHAALVALGVNDLMLAQFLPEPEAARFVDERVDQYRAQLRILAEEGIQIIVQEVILSRNTDLNRWIHQFNAKLRVMADQEGWAVFDPNPALTVDGLLQSDCARDEVHLSPVGYKAYAKSARDFLRTLN